MGTAYIKTRPKTVINVSRIITIHYFEFGPSFVFQGESHDFWELVYVDKGTVLVKRDEEEVILKQGEVIFHRPNEFHSIKALDSAPNFFVISFVCTSEAMGHFEKYQAKLDTKLKTFVSAIIKEAEKTYHIPKNHTALVKLSRLDNAPIGSEQLIQMYLEQLLIFILREITKTQKIPLFHQETMEENPLVNAIRKYLTDRAEETVRVEEICDEFGYSRSFLGKLFQSQTGETLAAFATKQKIERAKQLIRETGMNFSQIAVLLSFENPQYFSRVFKRCTGMTPTEFKNRAHV